MFKARHSLMVLVIVLLMSALAMPVQAQDGGEPVIAAQPCAEPGELTMWVWDEAWAGIIGESIELWKTEYCPGAEVTIEIQPWSEYWTLLKTNAAGGDLPDVFNMNHTYVFFYLDNEVLLNLQPYWDEFGVDTNLWGSGLVGPYRWGENGDL